MVRMKESASYMENNRDSRKGTFSVLLDANYKIITK
jgi:hypothetical protein